MCILFSIICSVCWDIYVCIYTILSLFLTCFNFFLCYYNVVFFDLFIKSVTSHTFKWMVLNCRFMDACMYRGVDIVKINGLMAVKGDSKSLKKFPRLINVFKQSPSLEVLKKSKVLFLLFKNIYNQKFTALNPNLHICALGFSFKN